MRLLFAGIAPSAALKKVLTANRFDLDIVKSSAKTKFTDPDLILQHFTKREEIVLADKWRKQFPNAWIVLIGKRDDISDCQNELIQNDSKSAVWTEEDWEEYFWLLFQQFLEVRKLQSKVNELMNQSDAVVSRIERDVTLAENIQKKLLPQHTPTIPGLRIAAKYIPATGLGGDYYDLFEFTDHKRLGILLADSKSHGIAAALLSVLIKVRVEEMKDRFPDSKSFVDFLNRELQHTAETMSLVYGILDRTTLQFQYTSAGDLQPVHWRDGASISHPPLKNPPLGTTDNFAYQERVVSLKPGDLILMHSDGLRAPLEAGADVHSKVIELLHEKSPFNDPWQIQNEFLGRIDRFLEKSKLPDDITLIQFAIDERALYKIS